MGDDTAIKVDRVSKKFCKTLKRSMVYGLTDIARNALGFSSHSYKLRKNEFWAVNDVSFELRKGETLGIIGFNGSGKTTMLKMLNGIFWPDKGKITMSGGRVSALIAVGAGFHPLLTGRENIYLNGAILGMSMEETDKKFDEIVDFADIGDFLNTPIKYYSSGMFVRLGFAIAINVQPDILLIDEILSVGDLSFQNKSLRSLAKIRESSSAVVFVSHNMEHMRSLCKTVLLLNQGECVYYGDIDEGIVKYQYLILEKKMREQKNKQKSSFKGLVHRSSGEILLGDCGMIDEFGRMVKEINFGENFSLFFEFETKCFLKELIFGAGVLNQDHIKCMADWSNDEKMNGTKKNKFADIQKGKYRLTLNYKNPKLVPGLYLPGFTIRNPITGETYEKIRQMDPIIINGNIIRRGIVKFAQSWELEYCE